MERSRAPPNRISPLAGASRPAKRRISVDFPQPFAPINAHNLPEFTRRETSRTTAVPGEYANSTFCASGSASPRLPFPLRHFGMQQLRKHGRRLGDQLRIVGRILLANDVYAPAAHG